MFVFISHLSVPEADRPALARHFRQRAHLVDGFPGFLYLQLLEPQGGDASYTFLTAWESRQARILAGLSAEERTGLAVGLRGLVRELVAEGILAAP